MAALNLKDAHVGVILAIQVFDEFFNQILKKDTNLQVFKFEVDSFGELELRIQLIRYFYLEEISTTLLGITGTMDILNIPHEIIAEVKLLPILKTKEEGAPVFGLKYDGVHKIQIHGNLEDLILAQSDLITSSIDEKFNDVSPGSIGHKISSVEIDLVNTLIAGIEVLLFPAKENRPERGHWTSELFILPAENADTLDSIAIFIASPGTSAATNVETSFLKSKTGFGIIFNKDFLQLIFDKGAGEQIGQVIEGAELRSLNLKLDNEKINIKGSVKKSGITINFEGPGFPFLYRGTTQMSIDASQVDAKEPKGLKGFLKFLAILTGIILPIVGTLVLGLVGLIGGIVADVWAVKGIWGAAEELDKADSLVQSGLAGSLGRELTALSEGLNFKEEIEEVTLESTPNQLNFINGHYFFDALIFVSPVVHTIINGWFSKSNNRFMFHQIASGQIFRTSELARLVKKGKIITPGFHAVKHQNGRLFMRANLDDLNANNLHQMFKLNSPEEPFIV